MRMVYPKSQFKHNALNLFMEVRSNYSDNISTFYIYLVKNWYSNNAQSRAYPSKSKKHSFLSGLSYTKILSSYRKMSDYVLSFPFALSPFIHVDCSSKAWYMLRDT